MESILTISAGVDSVAAAVLEPVNTHHRLVSWWAEPRTPAARISNQVAHVCQNLGEQMGRVLWDDQASAPFVQSEDAVRYPPLQHVVISASPRPRLQVWLFGLSERLSIAAARSAIASAPAHTVGQTSLATEADVVDLAHYLHSPQTDVIVICGGYESVDATAYVPVLELCQLVSQVLERVPPGQRPDIVYAGNRQAATAAREILQAAGDHVDVDDVENVMPIPGWHHQTGLAQALSYRYWRLSRRTPGFSQLERWVTRPGQVKTQEANFCQLLQVWSSLHEISDLHGVYTTSSWQLHVWVQENSERVRIHYASHEQAADEMRMWPPIQFVSGLSPAGWRPHDRQVWWDREGIVPAIAAVGQVSPQAMVEVLGEIL